MELLFLIVYTFSTFAKRSCI